MFLIGVTSVEAIIDSRSRVTDLYELYTQVRIHRYMYIHTYKGWIGERGMGGGKREYSGLYRIYLRYYRLYQRMDYAMGMRLYVLNLLNRLLYYTLNKRRSRNHQSDVMPRVYQFPTAPLFSVTWLRAVFVFTKNLNLSIKSQR